MEIVNGVGVTDTHVYIRAASHDDSDGRAVMVVDREDSSTPVHWVGLTVDEHVKEFLNLTEAKTLPREPGSTISNVRVEGSSDVYNRAVLDKEGRWWVGGPHTRISYVLWFEITQWEEDVI